ncbi:MAG: hypothetical protein ACO3LF_00995 [Candidatus Kariarchaeum pelagius]
MIEKNYLEEKAIKQIKQQYDNNKFMKSISLYGFFEDKFLNRIIDEIDNELFEKDHSLMNHRRYKASFEKLGNRVLENGDFLKLIEEICEIKLEKYSIHYELHRYKIGDYKILSDEDNNKKGIELIIDLTPVWDDENGGYLIYTNGDGEFYEIPSSYGSLTIVEREKNLQYFVKYVNHYAKNVPKYIFTISIEN